MFPPPYFRLLQVLTLAEVLNFMLSKLPSGPRKAGAYVRLVRSEQGLYGGKLTSSAQFEGSMAASGC